MFERIMTTVLFIAFCHAAFRYVTAMEQEGLFNGPTQQSICPVRPLGCSFCPARGFVRYCSKESPCKSPNQMCCETSCCVASCIHHVYANKELFASGVNDGFLGGFPNLPMPVNSPVAPAVERPSALPLAVQINKGFPFGTVKDILPIENQPVQSPIGSQQTQQQQTGTAEQPNWALLGGGNGGGTGGPFQFGGNNNGYTGKTLPVGFHEKNPAGPNGWGGTNVINFGGTDLLNWSGSNKASVLGTQATWGK